MTPLLCISIKLPLSVYLFFFLLGWKLVEIKLPKNAKYIANTCILSIASTVKIRVIVGKKLISNSSSTSINIQKVLRNFISLCFVFIVLIFDYRLMKNHKINRKYRNLPPIHRRIHIAEVDSIAYTFLLLIFIVRFIYTYLINQIWPARLERVNVPYNKHILIEILKKLLRIIQKWLIVLAFEANIRIPNKNHNLVKRKTNVTKSRNWRIPIKVNKF